MQTFTTHTPTEIALLTFGQHLAKTLEPFLHALSERALVVYLNGELGAGKTTLTRSIVQSLGYTGNVKSPTYTLVEEYPFHSFAIYHFDLYRLADPEELAFIGIKDYFAAHTLCLVEWASKGEGMLPDADLLIQIDYAEQGRILHLQPQSPTGEQLVANFKDNLTAYTL